jgi:23S rRNA (cytosine1962-C5)-methyltransferase
MQAYVKKCASIIESGDERRRREIGDRSIDAFRLVRGSADGAPAGLSIDRYLNFIIVTRRDSLRDDLADAWCTAARSALSPDAIVLKTMAKRTEDSTSRVIFGSVPAQIEVHEDDATFLCELDAGVQTGLFLDHQDTRFEIRDFASGVEVLNLFAYTCAFSVHAALAGATRVTNVDASKRALERGRTNMIASGLDPDRHRWFADDVFDHLKKKSPEYGLVIVDPPAFGRSKKRTFSLERDLDRLLEASIAKLAANGVLMFSTHSTELTIEDVARRIRMKIMSKRSAQRAQTGGGALPPRDPFLRITELDSLKIILARRG